jgi:hypothetical protein
MMKCGCSSSGAVCMSMNGVKYDPPIPVCIVHNCTDVVPDPVIPAGRMAHCVYNGGCKTRQAQRRDTSYAKEWGPDGNGRAPSSPNLPFFKSCPDKDHDEFFCGCFGWD